MTIDVTTLQAFSAGLLAMAELVRTSPPRRLTNDALLALRALVPFRSAWWGECSDSTADAPRKNWLHGRINLSPSFAREWNLLAENDEFASQSMRRLGEVVRSSGQEPDPSVQAFSARHGLDHVMAITVELPDSGLMFFVALYRGAEEAAFDDDESALFAEFTKHLLHHWRLRCRDLILARSPGSAEAFALAGVDGELLYLGARLGRLLHARYPQWAGSILPAELAAMLKVVPCTVAVGGERLTLQPCGELVVLALDRAGRRAALPPRERSAAMLYAQGHSYKEIARLLGLSPATVRTYLRSVYLHLRVRNKIELGDALDAAT